MTNGTADASSTAWKRPCDSWYAACARARSMNVAALRAQMSASVRSRSVGARAVSRCTEIAQSTGPDNAKTSQDMVR